MANQNATHVEVIKAIAKQEDVPASELMLVVDN
jgi:hypothetical protein